MAEFVQIKLDDMLNQLGENEVKSILSSFVCNENFDVQDLYKIKQSSFHDKVWRRQRWCIGSLMIIKKSTLLDIMLLRPNLYVFPERLLVKQWQKN